MTKSLKYVLKALQLKGGDGSASCNQDRLARSGYTTAPWLLVDAILKKSNRSGVLKAILDEHRVVVVKVGEAGTLVKEFDVAKMLTEHGVQGFAEPFCKFSCEDDFTRYGSMQQNMFPLCNGKAGNRMHAIVMPYYEKGSVRTADWSHGDIGLLLVVVRAAILSLCQAYDRCGLVYNDSHLDNIMLVQRNAAISSHIDICGHRFVWLPDAPLAPAWIDLENAIIDAPNKHNPKFLYMDIANIINHMQYDLEWRFKNCLPIISLLDSLRSRNVPLTVEVVHAIDSALTHIDVEGKRPQFTLRYDPNVY